MTTTFYKERRTVEKLCSFIKRTKLLSMGPKCLEFEAEFAGRQGRKHSVFFNSGSSANLALIQSLLNLKVLKKGDTVGFSALTWATNVMPLLQLGLKAVPIDVSMENLNVMSGTFLQIAGRYKFKALFVTNLLGFCGDLENLRETCRKEKILFLEDNCESLGSRHRDRLLGNFGLASTFSTYVGHHLSTIEGGLVCTDDDGLCDMLRMVRSHGWDRNLGPQAKKRLRAKNSIDEFHSKYTFYELGYNLRPTEISGFLGLEQLSYHRETTRKRQANFKLFQAALLNNPELEPLKLKHMDLVSNFAFPVIGKTPQIFEKYRTRFEENHVEIRPIVAGSMVEQPFFRKWIGEGHTQITCPNAKKIHRQGFYFPNRPDLSEREIGTLCRLLG